MNFRSTTDALVYLLECELATYTGLALKKSTPQSALDRHEKIIENVFVPCRHDIAIAASSMGPGYPRVMRLCRLSAELGDPKEALERYFNDHVVVPPGLEGIGEQSAG